MDMATNEMTFTTTSTIFSTAVTARTSAISDNPQPAIILTKSQVVLHAVVDSAVPAATTGPGSISSGTEEGGPTAGLMVMSPT